MVQWLVVCACMPRSQSTAQTTTTHSLLHPRVFCALCSLDPLAFGVGDDVFERIEVARSSSSLKLVL